MSAPHPVIGPDWAIEAGWSIIPLGPSKKPIITSWKPFQGRQPTRKELAEWKKLRPAAWGLITGAVSGRITLDFDGAAGADTMRSLGIDPHRQTPSGGFHADFAYPGWSVQTLNGKAKRELGAKWPGLDLRGDGGYAAFCGRTDKGKYTWLRDSSPHDLGALPRDLREFLGVLSPPPEQHTNGKPKAPERVSSARLIQDGLDRVARDGRNTAGFWLAAQLRDNGYARDEASAVLREYRRLVGSSNTKGQKETYSEAEVLATLDQVYSRPAREPWGQKPNDKSAPAPKGPVPVVPIRSTEPLILNRNGEPRALLANAITVLRSDPRFRGLAFDEFRLRVVVFPNSVLPWRTQTATWGDHEDRLTAEWLQRQGICVGLDVAGQAVQVVARDRSFHPVREYLGSLKWDGEERIDEWLTSYFGVAPTTFTKAVGPRWLISAVARIFEPGTKADCALVFEGIQGLKKSTALRIIAGEYFTDELADMGSKDAAMQTLGVWIIEIADLHAMKRNELSRIKAFMSRSVDRFRPPYGRHLIESPRQCVFAGSVNDRDWNEDATGARRWWPVTCGDIDVDALKRDRDQLWAEAVVGYRAGRVWWLESADLNRAAEEEQSGRLVADPWDAAITEFILGGKADEHGRRERRDNVSVPEILTYIGKDPEHWVVADEMRVGKCLVARKWERYKTQPDQEGRRQWRYRAPLAERKQMPLGI